jgi:hypothetical protein
MSRASNIAAAATDLGALGVRELKLRRLHFREANIHDDA